MVLEESIAVNVNEATPLLIDSDIERGPEDVNIQNGSGPATGKITPLPWSQMMIIMLVLLAEPMTSQVISPFAPQLMRDVGVTHGDESKIGYYVGMMQSLFFVTESFTIMYWSRASDRYGRKPILMIGLFGLCISMVFFGLSKTFPELVVSRSLAGALNGNVGVAKSVIAELSDSTNMARAFSYIPVNWAIGSTIGPATGGYLSNPADQFPNVFGRFQILKDFPYLLPCATSALFSGTVCLIVFLLFKETAIESSDLTDESLNSSGNVSTGASTPTLVANSQSASSASLNKQKGVSNYSNPPLISTAPQRLLTWPVVLATANYALIAMGASFYGAFLPVFFATPIKLGGLDLPPSSIGTVMTTFGILNGIVQIASFSKMNQWLGTKRLCLVGLWGFVLQYGMFPIENWIARNNIGGIGNDSLLVYCAVALQIFGNIMSEMAFGCVLIFVSAAAPNRRMLGATNGVAQMVVSIVRAIGPALVNSLFSLSIEKNILGGHGYIVYVIQLCLVLAMLRAASLFPKRPWTNGLETPDE